jgi:hypothetical protein
MPSDMSEKQGAAADWNLLHRVGNVNNPVKWAKFFSLPNWIFINYLVIVY